MMVLLSLFSFIFAIVMIVSFHELGHYLFARWAGVFVHRFSVGFGHILFSKKDVRGCEWALSSIPLGGYVKLHSNVLDDQVAHLTSEDAVSLEEVPVWKQFLIFFAGPLFSFLLGFLIYFLVALYGTPVRTADVLKVLPDTPAAKAGLLVNDRLVDVDHRGLNHLADIQSYLILKSNQKVVLSVKRENQFLDIPVHLSSRSLDDGTKLGYLGVMFNGKVALQYQSSSVMNALGIATKRTFFLLENTARISKKMLTADVSPKQLSGPLLTARIGGIMITKGWIFFIQFVALLSVSIGFINLLPIPGLDGGHMLFSVIHMIRGKPLSDKYKEKFFMLGYCLVFSLMIWTFYNDIVRLFA
ncbi:MAG: M50 family metallopeptidase [Alcaligenaceae bacterium]|nr:M50 family metallopeptidase [Alcaligenaceae bacterium]